MKVKKISNTCFNVESVKKMTLKGFKDTYSKILKGQDTEGVYKKITSEK